MIMVTGSTGFVGRHIVQAIAASGSEVLATYRNSPRPEWSGSSHIKSCKVDSLDSGTNWIDALKGVDTVIHCAALAHGYDGDSWATNVEGTRVLAEQAAKNGVRRLVFLSSIAVYGSIPTGVLRENQELFADSEISSTLYFCVPITLVPQVKPLLFVMMKQCPHLNFCNWWGRLLGSPLGFSGSRTGLCTG